MKTQKLVLVIGLLGIISSIIGIIIGQEPTINLIGFICGTSLLHGYFELKKVKNE